MFDSSKSVLARGSPLAEQLLDKALALEPTDGEVWAAAGMLAGGHIVLGHDRSAARMEAARSVTERAIKLAPESDQARFARAAFLRFHYATRPEAERLLRELVARNPTDGFLLRTLAALLRGRRQTDECLAILDHAIALPGGDPLALYNKYLALAAALRFDEAEAAVDQGLALRPMPYLQRAKVTCLATFHGDLDGAASVLEKVPPAYLLEDSGAFWASQTWLWRREPAKSLTVLQSFRRELMECNEFRGPKAFLVGQAHGGRARRGCSSRVAGGLAQRRATTFLVTKRGAVGVLEGASARSARPARGGGIVFVRALSGACAQCCSHAAAAAARLTAEAWNASSRFGTTRQEGNRWLISAASDPSVRVAASAAGARAVGWRQLSWSWAAIFSNA